MENMLEFGKGKFSEEKLFEKIRLAIIDGFFRPGEHLVEQDLAKMFGVSRTPVRKALEKLARENLVVRTPNKGVTVSKLTIRQVQEIYELRSVLEGLSAYLTTQKSDSEKKRQLVEIVASGRSALEKNDLAAARRYNDLFHSTINAASDNQLLTETLNNMRWHLGILLVSTWATKGRPQDIQQEHEAILNAILQGEAEQARSLAINHITNACNVAMEVMRKETKVVSEYLDQDNYDTQSDA